MKKTKVGIKTGIFEREAGKGSPKMKTKVGIKTGIFEEEAATGMFVMKTMELITLTKKMIVLVVHQKGPQRRGRGTTKEILNTREARGMHPGTQWSGTSIPRKISSELFSSATKRKKQQKKWEGERNLGLDLLLHNLAQTADRRQGVREPEEPSSAKTRRQTIAFRLPDREGERNLGLDLLLHNLAQTADRRQGVREPEEPSSAKTRRQTIAFRLPDRSVGRALHQIFLYIFTYRFFEPLVRLKVRSWNYCCPPSLGPLRLNPIREYPSLLLLSLDRDRMTSYNTKST
nr:uncharacterized protein LOC113822017 [Penaeus vannamei]